MNTTLLQKYDTGGDGKINYPEMLNAKHDNFVGTLSDEGMAAVTGIWKSQETIPGDRDGDFPVKDKGKLLFLVLMIMVVYFTLFFKGMG